MYAQHEEEHTTDSCDHWHAAQQPSQLHLPTCLNSFWNRARGKLFQAMVSVMAVKIQFNSPNGVFRSVWRPGMRSISSLDTPARQSYCPLHGQGVWEDHIDAVTEAHPKAI
jgi:hypothetical protein